MKALKKNFENLKKVVVSICAVDFSNGRFTLAYISSRGAILESPGRNYFGISIVSMIPSNWEWSISFDDNILSLFIRIK